MNLWVSVLAGAYLVVCLVKCVVDCLKTPAGQEEPTTEWKDG